MCAVEHNFDAIERSYHHPKDARGRKIPSTSENEDRVQELGQQVPRG